MAYRMEEYVNTPDGSQPLFCAQCCARGGRLCCSTVDSRLEYMAEKTTIIALIICAVKRRQRDSLQQRVQAEHGLFTPRRHFGTENFTFLFSYNIYLRHSCFYINVNKP